MNTRWLPYAALAALLACSQADRPGRSPRSDLAEAQGTPQRGARSEPPPAPPPALSMSVDPSRGQLTASVALPALPTRAGLDPALTIDYAGTSVDFGEGLGAGFALSVPSITASDEYGLTLSPAAESDPFITPLTYGGQRLMFVRSGDRGTVEYRPELSEQPTRVYYHPTETELTAVDGQRLAFRGFLVVHADGSREIYSEDPQVAEFDIFEADGERVLITTRFPLRYRLSPGGDVIEYLYQRKEDDGRSYLTAVVFAGGRSRYEFTLEKLPSPPDRPVFSQGFEQRQTHVYTRIVASFDGSPIQRLYLVYRTSDGTRSALLTNAEAREVASREFPLGASAPLSEESVLVGVLRYAGGTDPIASHTLRLPPVAFSYADRTREDLEAQTGVRTIPLTGVSGFGPTQGAEYVDVDQDGLVDVASTDGSGTRTTVHLNTGALADGTFAAQSAPLTVTRVGQGAQIAPSFRGGVSAAWLPGDFDGDGIADLLQIERAQGGAGSLLTLYAGQSGSSSYAPSLGSYPSSRALGTFLDGRAQVVDINADGRDDLVMAVQDGVTWSFDVLLNFTRSFGKPEGGKIRFVDIREEFGVSLEAPRMFGAPASAGVDFRLSAPQNRLTDVNGDGLADLTVVRITAAGEKGLCVFENRGALRANVDVEGAVNAKDLLLFGDRSTDSPTCTGGYFVPVQDLDPETSINALWLVDVTGDGLSDLVNVAGGNRHLVVWAGRGRDGFRSLGRIALREPLRVDPSNRWNTRVLDFDGDGMEEILVYENDPSQGPRLHVVDFNRLDGKDLTPPLLLTAAREGKGMTHLVQYASSTDELLRDRAHQRGDARGVPFVTPVVKRLVTHLGEAPSTISEYRYHAARADLVGRAPLGFGEVDIVSYGDEHAEHAVSQVAYDVDGDRFEARVLADREIRRTISSLADDVRTRELLRVLDAAPRDGPPALSFVSQTAETRSEAPLPAGERRASIEATWETDASPTVARPPLHLRMTREQTTTYGADGAGAIVTRSLVWDACNRLESELRTDAAVVGPLGARIPERTTRTSTGYEIPCESGLRGPDNLPLSSIRSVVTTSASGRVLARTVLAYAPDQRFAPSSITTSGSLDPTGVPPPIAATLREVPPRTLTYTYDRYLNVLATGDELGSVDETVFDSDGVRAVARKNALGHTERLAYDAGVVGPSSITTARGDTVELGYDALQRLRQVRKADGSTTRYEYREPDAHATRRVKVTESRTRTELHETLHVARGDGLSIARIEPSEDGGARALDRVAYGRRADVVREGVPAKRNDTPAGLFESAPDGAFSIGGTACGGDLVACSSYDALGRIVSYTSASGRYREQTRHEAWGSRVDVSDDGDRRTRQTVQRGDVVYAVVDEAGHVHHFDRDEAEQLTAVRLAGESTPRLTRADSLGRVAFSSIPLGMSKVFERDARGRVVREEIFDTSSRSGGYLVTAYDALDRPTERKSFTAGASPTLTDTLTFAYDEQPGGSPGDVGTLVRATARDELAESTFEETFSHDADGRTTARRAIYRAADVTRSYEEGWEYYLDGLVESYSDPFGNRLSYEPTPAGGVGTLTWHRESGAVVLARATAFDDFGRATRLERPAHRLEETRAYERASGLLAGRRACSAGQCLEEDVWKRRGDGRVLSRDAGDLDARYTYTPRGELRRATLGDVSYDYHVDPAGHLLSCGELEPPALSRAESPLALPAGFAHDDFGRVTRGGEIQDVVYDVEGRTRAVSLPDKRILYSYSARGERVSRRVQGADELTVYPTPDTRDDGAERQSRVAFEDQPLALLVGQTSFGLLTDHRDVVEALVSEAGEPRDTVRFSPYGAPRAGTASATSGLGSRELAQSFTGSLRDDETGLVHMGAREYLAGLGAFTTPDPLFQSEPDLCAQRVLECAGYGYVANDPVNYVDPTGTAKNTNNRAKLSAKQKRQKLKTRRATQRRASNGGRDQGEVYYRAMSSQNAAELAATRNVPATAETMVSTRLSYSENYRGVLVRLTVRGGTTDKLVALGVRDTSALTRAAHPDMPRVQSGWAANHAFFKGEGDGINIGLGQGAALEAFNKGIIHVEFLRR